MKDNNWTAQYKRMICDVHRAYIIYSIWIWCGLWAAWGDMRLIQLNTYPDALFIHFYAFDFIVVCTINVAVTYMRIAHFIFRMIVLQFSLPFSLLLIIIRQHRHTHKTHLHTSWMRSLISLEIPSDAVYCSSFMRFCCFFYSSLTQLHLVPWG